MYCPSFPSLGGLTKAGPIIWLQLQNFPLETSSDQPLPKQVEAEWLLRVMILSATHSETDLTFQGLPDVATQAKYSVSDVFT